MQNSACLTTFLSAMLIGFNVISGSCISKLIGLKFASFISCHFLSKPPLSLLLGLQLHVQRSASQQNLMKILLLREREVIKAAEKDLSTTIVTSVHSTGATVVGSVNATEFWQRANTATLIFTIAQLQNGSCNSTVIHSSPGSQMIYYNYCFCNSYFCFLHWCAVFHWNNS